MIKFYKSKNGEHLFIKLNGEYYQVFYDTDTQEYSALISKNRLVTLTKERITSQKKIPDEVIAEFQFDLCHYPNRYLANSKSCSKCECRVICECHLNTIKIHKKKEKESNAGTSQENDKG